MNKYLRKSLALESDEPTDNEELINDEDLATLGDSEVEYVGDTTEQVEALESLYVDLSALKSMSRRVAVEMYNNTGDTKAVRNFYAKGVDAKKVALEDLKTRILDGIKSVIQAIIDFFKKIIGWFGKKENAEDVRKKYEAMGKAERELKAKSNQAPAEMRKFLEKTADDAFQSLSQMELVFVSSLDGGHKALAKRVSLDYVGNSAILEIQKYSKAIDAASALCSKPEEFEKAITEASVIGNKLSDKYARRDVDDMNTMMSMLAKGVKPSDVLNIIAQGSAGVQGVIEKFDEIHGAMYKGFLSSYDSNIRTFNEILSNAEAMGQFFKSPAAASLGDQNTIKKITVELNNLIRVSQAASRDFTTVVRMLAAANSAMAKLLRQSIKGFKEYLEDNPKEEAVAAQIAHMEDVLKDLASV